MFRGVKAKFAWNPFRRDEDGSIIVFVMVVFSAMFLVGGTAVDLARHENLRSTLQYNLDRAVLAAASLKQQEDPDVVVADYMSKVVTISDFTLDVDYTVAINAREVEATATAELDTWFLSMAGIDTMPITAHSAAEERIPNLEISLVLDVSGSMSGQKIANLKVAAKEFITTMLDGVDEDSVAISIIPFNHNVAPNDAIFDNITIAQTHNLSNCLEFEDADFRSTGIDPTEAQTQAIFTSLYGSFQDFTSGYETCFAQPWFEIMPYSDNEAALHAKIDSLQAGGWTAGHLGLKWGLALLDPLFQPVVDALIAQGVVDAGFHEMPVDWAEPQTLKVVVFMGDGANTYEFLFGDRYRGDDSPLWEVVEEEPGQFTHLTYYGRTYYGSRYERYCGYSGVTCYYGDPVQVTNFYLKSETSSNYLEIDDNEWISESEFLSKTPGQNGVISVQRLTWEEAWGHMPANWYDQKTGGRAFNDLVYNSSRSTSEADDVMEDACDAARDAGIVVYTIGYETDQTTSDKLRDCATTSAHYYDAEGTNISTVFAAIASSIQKLKLTQ